MAALAIASCSSNGDSASTKADSYEVMNKAITQAGQEARSKAMEIARANDMGRTQSTATSVTDPWIVSQKAELIGEATGSMMTYRYTITVKKDKPSSWVALEHVSTDIDGEWPPGYPEEPSIGFGGTTWEITEENPDGSTTYQTELWVQKGFTSTHKPYENQRFRYRFHLVKKDQTYVTSSQFCYPELPC